MEIKGFMKVSPRQRRGNRFIYLSFLEKLYNVNLSKNYRCFIAPKEKKIFIFEKKEKVKVPVPNLEISITYWKSRGYSYITLGKCVLHLMGDVSKIEDVKVLKNGKVFIFKLN